jgi:hypothetical protein
MQNINQEVESIPKLLEEDLSHIPSFGIVKYRGKFKLRNLHKKDTKGIITDCFNGCSDKFFEYGREHGLYPDHIGLTIRSTKIPYGGEICEPIKKNTNLHALVKRILNKLEGFNVQLNEATFTVIITGVQRSVLPTSPSSSKVKKVQPRNYLFK